MVKAEGSLNASRFTCGNTSTCTPPPSCLRHFGGNLLHLLLALALACGTSAHRFTWRRTLKQVCCTFKRGRIWVTRRCSRDLPAQRVLQQTRQMFLQGDSGAVTREGPGRAFFLLLNESGWMWGINLLSCQHRIIVKV